MFPIPSDGHAWQIYVMCLRCTIETFLVPVLSVFVHNHELTNAAVFRVSIIGLILSGFHIQFLDIHRALPQSCLSCKWVLDVLAQRIFVSLVLLHASAVPRRQAAEGGFDFRWSRKLKFCWSDPLPTHVRFLGWLHPLACSTTERLVLPFVSEEIRAGHRSVNCRLMTFSGTSSVRVMGFTEIPSGSGLMSNSIRI